MTENIYRTVIERDEDGYWFVDFPDVPGCHTQGRTLARARERMRDALSLFVENADTAEIAEEITFADADLTKIVLRSQELRQVLEAVRTESQEVTAKAARRLTEAGLSRRDAGEVLGLSFQRVDQLVRTDEPRAQAMILDPFVGEMVDGLLTALREAVESSIGSRSRIGADRTPE
jgi:predicted RNase H-like HicB family nuclease/predicted transcriptional regulator